MRAKKKIFCLFGIWLFALVFFVCSVSAIGISGSSLNKDIYFIPNLQVSEMYGLKSTSSQTMDYELYAIMEKEVHGKNVDVDLTPYVVFEPEILKSVPPLGIRQFNVKVSLPSNIDIPGSHILRICVMESLTSGGQFGSRSAACAILNIIVQHEGKHLSARLDAPDTNIGEEVYFKVNVQNWGKETIEEVKAKVNVYDYNGNLKRSVNSNSVSLGATESKELVAVLDTSGYESGVYTAEAVVDWDGEKTILNKSFRIGLMDIEIKDYTNEFERNKINPFHIEVENLWNGRLENVYAVVDLPDGMIQTPTMDLRAWESKRLTAYWETTEVEAGKHEAKIIIHFEGQTKTEEIIVEVIESEEDESTVNGFLLVGLILGLAILALIAWGIFRRNGNYALNKKDKKKRKYF